MGDSPRPPTPPTGSPPPAGCPERLLLERLAAGETVDSSILEHATSCPKCRDILAEIQERDRFLTGFMEMGRPKHDTDPGKSAADLGETPTAGFPTLARPGATTADRNQARTIGPYVLISELGQGGFGEVWLAERLEPFVKRVAIKVIKLGMDSAAVLARFEQERQALAMMDHPNIARVLDGGVASREGWGSGRPYFVMEYVDGVSITDYCDQRKLGTRDRLLLFLTVCEAVEHAHMKGIIHRDIKPSNILVTETEGSPVAKVIDFGIAKAIGGALTDKTIFTEQGQFIGTPEYMSPEQMEMGPRDIDTRTDVYSLGILLYELLSGSLPFEARRLRSAGFDEIRRIIREVDPPKPSARLTTMNEIDAGAIATSRRTSRHTLARELRAELDWIPLMAMRKDRTKRYASPAELARDVRNYLEGRALIAGPESAIYRIGKIVRRHLVAFSSGGVALFGLVLGLTLALIALDRETTARKAETQQRRLAEQSVSFLEDTVGAANPTMLAMNRPRTLAEVLAGAVKLLDEGRMRDQPAAEARLRHVIGAALLGVREAVQSIEQLRLAAQLQRALPHPDPLSLATTEVILSDAMVEAGLEHDAIKLAQEIADRRQAEAGPNDALAGEATRVVGGALLKLNDLDRAEATLRKALAIQRIASPGNPQLGETMNSLADALAALGRSEEAVPLRQEALVVFRRSLGESHPSIGTVYNNVAFDALQRGDLDLAEDLIDQAIEMVQQAWPGDPTLAKTILLRTDLQIRRKQYDAAQASATRALEICRASQTSGPAEIAECLGWLARAQRAAGDNQSALESFDRAIDLLRPLTSNTVQLRALLWDGALLRVGTADTTRADAMLAEAEMLLRNDPNRSPTWFAYLLSDRAWVLQMLRQYEPAAAKAEEALREPSLQGQRRARALDALGRTRLLAADFTSAESLFREAVAIREAVADSLPREINICRAELGLCLTMAGRADEGLGLLLAACQSLEADPAASAGMRKQAMTWLADALDRAGRAGEAAQWRKRVEGVGL